MSTAQAPTAADVLYAAELPGGATWSHVLKRGTALRIRDIEGRANVGAMLYRAGDPVERLSVPDTLKAQYTARLTAPHVLMSDMGRALCSIVHDTCGWHDAIGGHTRSDQVAAQYGARAYQEARNDMHRSARDGFLAELLALGLGIRDLQPNVNFFSKVVVEEGGALTFAAGNSHPGAEVVLRAELDTLVLLNTCQHPLDPAPAYDPAPVALTVQPVAPAAADDPSRRFRDESARALANTEADLA